MFAWAASARKEEGADDRRPHLGPIGQVASQGRGCWLFNQLEFLFINRARKTARSGD